MTFFIDIFIKQNKKQANRKKYPLNSKKICKTVKIVMQNRNLLNLIRKILNYNRNLPKLNRKLLLAKKTKQNLAEIINSIIVS